jgi:proteasome lid subunit RPN8/RPN11
MRNLWLTDEQARAIVEHARSEQPREACGLLAGTDHRVLQVLPLPNSAADPIHHFRIDDHALIQTLYRIEQNGLSLLGIYHSHPNGDPIPSTVDIREAAYPDCAYVIAGLRGSPRLAAWDIRDAVVTPVELHTAPQPPEKRTEPLSRPQKAAIVVGAVLAFAFMLVLSLSLLPPAPIIVNLTPVP